MERIPTTREIAEASGYHQSSVSRALASHPDIPAGTRREILKTARRLGWRPNPLASAYMCHVRNKRGIGYRTNLAFLINDPEERPPSQMLGHTKMHVASAARRAEELGYKLDTIWLQQPGLTAKGLRKILRNRNNPGVIIPRITEPLEVFEDFPWEEFACVMIGNSLSTPKFDRVTTNTLHGIMMALEKIRELGYRHVAVVFSGDIDMVLGHGLLCAAQYEKGLTPKGHRLDICPYKGEGSKALAKVRDWLDKHRPQVVLGNKIAADAIAQLGWKIPRDVAYASTDYSENYPAIGGFCHGHDRHGAIAVEMLAGLIVHNQRGIPLNPKSVMVEGYWVDAPSIPPLSQIPNSSNP